MDENKPKFTYEELANKYLEKKQDDKSNKKNTKDFAFDYSAVVTFFVTVLALIFLGLFLGIKLDKFLNTSPLFLIIFIFLGIAAAFRNLIVYITRKR